MPVHQLRLQLLSQAQDESAFELVRLLGPLVSWPQVKPRMRAWARGWVRRKGGRLKTMDALIQALSEHAANEIEIAFEVSEPYSLGKSGLSVDSIRCVLKVSPTNSLWASVRGFVLSGREDEARRASFESRELALRWNEITNCPTLLDVVCETDSDLDGEHLLHAFWTVLPQELPASDTWTGTSGCAELLAETHFHPDVLESLAPWPRAYSLLGHRFDDLHSILLGQLSTTDGLARALGHGVEVKRITCGSSQESLGVLWLPNDMLNDPEKRVCAQPWLVTRDSTTTPLELQAGRGEFRVGSHVFYTQRRLKELDASGRLPTLPSGFRRFPLVATKYCAQVGIDPEEMLVDLWQDPLIDQAQHDIDRALSQSDSGTPLIERIWQAHEATYRKWLYGPDERLAFLKTHFFEQAGRVD